MRSPRINSDPAGVTDSGRSSYNPYSELLRMICDRVYVLSSLKFVVYLCLG